MPVSLRLVIFDCDGVLVDSEPIAEAVLGTVLGELGVMLSRADVRRTFFGKTVAQCVEIIESLTGGAVTDEWITAWRERLYATYREAPVRAVDGVREVLEALRQVPEVPVCVVSNGPIAKMDTTLGVTGLRQYFGARLFSPELGIAGKPAPDLFLAAASEHGVPPQRCAVIEDSAGGVRGARAAGMRALGFTGLVPGDSAALAAAGAELFAEMRLLPALLGRS